MTRVSLGIIITMIIIILMIVIMMILMMIKPTPRIETMMINLRKSDPIHGFWLRTT